MSSSAQLSCATSEELTCATTLLHILYWSTVDNQLRPTCEWRTYVETSCRLLAPTAPALMEAVTQHDSQHFLGEAKELKACRNEANMKLPEPAPGLIAHTPEGHPYLGRLSFGPVERARGFAVDAKYNELVELMRWMNPDLTR